MILTGLLFLVVVLFQAETNFNRPLENESREGLPASQLPTIRAGVKSSWIGSLGITSWYNRYVELRRGRVSETASGTVQRSDTLHSSSLPPRRLLIHLPITLGMPDHPAHS